MQRYGDDVLAPRVGRRALPEVEASSGLIVRDRVSGFTGAVVGVERDAVTLRDHQGRERVFGLQGSFSIDGRPVALIRSRPETGPAGPTRTASGSIAGPSGPARVAQASRILVEGLHDAELLERVWGDDLRDEGIVVEQMEGVDDLPAIVRAFAPGPGRRLGVLVDHLVPGAKETRIAAEVTHPHVLVTGHPYVDVWQAVRPAVVGLVAWPEVPRGRPWKEGVCEALGVDEPALLWRRLLRSVGSYADLEPGLVGAVERLLDFLLIPE